MRRFTFLLLQLPISVIAQTWTQLPDFPGIARDDAASFVIGDHIYVGTGMEVSFALTNDWWGFSSATMTWAPVALLPSTPRQHCSTFVINGNGYLFGGVDGNGYLNQLWSYEPAMDQWTQRTSLPDVGRMSCVGFSINNIGYIATGRYGPDTAITNELWSYDAVLDEWAQHASLPGRRRLLGAAFAIGGFGYVETGQDSLAQGMSESWRYDPVGDSWSATSSFPGTPRFGATGLSAEGNLGIVACGTQTYSSPYLDDVWIYEPLGDFWSTIAAFPGGSRKGASGGFVQGTGIFLGIGSDLIQRYTDWYMFTGPLGIENHAAPNAPSLLSSVVDDRVTVLLPNYWLDVRADVFDASGRVCSSFACTSRSTEFNTGALHEGSYFLRVRSDDTTHTLRFVLMH